MFPFFLLMLISVYNSVQKVLENQERDALFFKIHGTILHRNMVIRQLKPVVGGCFSGLLFYRLSPVLLVVFFGDLVFREV